MEKNQNSGMSRREFLKTSALLGAMLLRRSREPALRRPELFRSRKRTIRREEL